MGQRAGAQRTCELTGGEGHDESLSNASVALCPSLKAQQATCVLWMECLLGDPIFSVPAPSVSSPAAIPTDLTSLHAGCSASAVRHRLHCFTAVLPSSHGRTWVPEQRPHVTCLQPLTEVESWRSMGKAAFAPALQENSRESAVEVSYPVPFLLSPSLNSVNFPECCDIWDGTLRIRPTRDRVVSEMGVTWNPRGQYHPSLAVALATTEFTREMETTQCSCYRLSAALRPALHSHCT